MQTPGYVQRIYEVRRMNDEQREEIVRLIKEGYTRGRLELGNGCLYWELKTEEWEDKKDVHVQRL